MKVSAITNNYYNQKNNIPNTNFTGLTKLMKRKIYVDGKKDILDVILSRKPEQSTVIGQLPAGIFNKLTPDKAKRIVAINDIMQTFGEITEMLRSFKCGINTSDNEFKYRRSEETVEKLNQVFKKHNLISPEESIDLQFLGRGDYGSVYKLAGFKDKFRDDEYVLKVFTVADRGPDWHRYKSHGNFAEPNTAEYWLNTWGKDTQRVMFYFADINSGYMVNKYIDMKTPHFKRSVNEYTSGLKLTDEEMARNGHNRINGYSIDWGGVRVVNRVKNESKTARAVLHKIKRTQNDYREIEWWRLHDNKSLDKEQKDAGLALAIKHIQGDDKKSKYIDICLGMRETLVDEALGYVLKYMSHENALKYFELLMRRNNEITQTILMNEIPLLARKPMPEKYDDMDVPKDEIISEKVKEFYDIAKKYVLPEAKEHLASYVHLLPPENIMEEFEYLVNQNDYNIYDRLLHKIRIVPEEEFPFDLKFKMLDKLEEKIQDPYLKEHAKKIKINTIRKTLAD